MVVKQGGERKMVCPNCGKEISASRFCPECGIELNGSSYVETYEKRPKKPIFKRWWFWVIVFVILLASIGSKVGEDSQHSIDHNEKLLLQMMGLFTHP